jgi:putative CRISPR-associated protein (TIGR02620 family)
MIDQNKLIETTKALKDFYKLMEELAKNSLSNFKCKKVMDRHKNQHLEITAEEAKEFNEIPYQSSENPANDVKEVNSFQELNAELEGGMPNYPIVIVTRHPGLVEFLMTDLELPEDTPVFKHATTKDVKGKHVYGVLPMHLAKDVALITEVNLELPEELRNKELIYEDVCKLAKELITYKINVIARTDIPMILA